MHHDELPPPHFHLYKAGKQYRFSIETLKQLEQDTERAPNGLHRQVMQWAKQKGRQVQLTENWVLCLKGEKPKKIT